MNRIKELRKKYGYTQEYLGQYLNITKAAISKYELERSMLTDDTIRSLCSLFNVTSDYLLGISDIPDGYNKTLTKEEKTLLSYYKRLSLEDQDYIKGQMIALYREKSSKDAQTKRTG